MFTDPVAQVIVTSPDKQNVWNWSAPYYPFLTGLTIMWEWERVASISLNIDAPYEDGIEKLLKEPTPITIGNQIQARIGYASGEFTPWAVGFLKEAATPSRSMQMVWVET